MPQLSLLALSDAPIPEYAGDYDEKQGDSFEKKDHKGEDASESTEDTEGIDILSHRLLHRCNIVF